MTTLQGTNLEKLTLQSCILFDPIISKSHLDCKLLAITDSPIHPTIASLPEQWTHLQIVEGNVGGINVACSSNFTGDEMMSGWLFGRTCGQTTDTSHTDLAAQDLTCKKSGVSENKLLLSNTAISLELSLTPL